MSGPVIAVLAFVLMMGSATGGAFLRRREPLILRSAEAREVIRNGTGLVAILAALLLGMGVAAMKSTFDAADQDVRRLATQVEELDRTLRRIGPPATAARDLLFRYTAATLRETWPTLDPGMAGEHRPAILLQDALEGALEQLVPPPALGRVLTQAQAVLHAMIETRWSMEERSARLIPDWQYVLLIAWLMLTFAGLGLATPRHRLVGLVLTLCSGAVASALFLLREFDDPFVGLLVVSGKPLLNALHMLADG